MSSRSKGSAFRDLNFGTRVDRAAATIPQTANGVLFNVTGGRVAITGFVGQVTTVIGGAATTAKIVSTPTVGTAVDLTAAVAITTQEVGSQVTLPAATGGNLVVKNGGGGGQLQPVSPYVVPVGTIGVTTSASTTGAMSWTVTYVPLDDGAAVSAA